MNRINWKIAVVSVLIMFLSTACSKKLMPPEIETSGSVESSDFTGSNGTLSKADEFGGSGGPDDTGFFSEEAVLEKSNLSADNGDSGVMEKNSGSSKSNSSSVDGFGSSKRADIGNGSSGTFSATTYLKDIHFNFDKYDLDSNTKKILEVNAAFLRSNPKLRVEIQGHSDERGTNNYNIALGERRANSTKKYLVAQGVDSNRVNIISYGEEKPFCTVSNNENCWYLNRRAHFRVAR
jgi:peptidoglycan-associated lipoprotein